jgi:hypothetical protein
MQHHANDVSRLIQPEGHTPASTSAYRQTTTANANDLLQRITQYCGKRRINNNNDDDIAERRRTDIRHQR